jgi:excisionase family DNA binding protein
MRKRIEPPERLLTIDEAAEILNVSPKTIRRRIAARELPAIRDGRSVRVSPDDLRSYIAKRRSA